jgi:hypothetical protein
VADLDWAPAHLRPVLEQLAEHGARRRRALAEAEAELDAMRPLLREALEARVTIAELARLAAVSRPTLYELRGRV